MEPLKALLKPRATTLACTRPPRLMSTPGVARRWSVTVSAGRSAMRSLEITEICAGASSAFSGRLRLAVTTVSVSCVGRSVSAAVTDAPGAIPGKLRWA